MGLRWSFGLVLALAVAVAPLAAEVVTRGVGFDRWMYPFNQAPGVRPMGSVFGAVGSADFDDRDAQLLMGFDVSGAGPTPSQVLTGIQLRITTAADQAFVYDPTWDPLETYLGVADSDPGRPLELFGVGTRNGFTGLTLDDASPDPTLFKETSPYSTVPGVFTRVRSAYAAAADGAVRIDVSNQVRDGLTYQPWAIGQTDQVQPGNSVPINVPITFDMDLHDANVAAYVQNGISAGALFFSVTGFHPAAPGVPTGVPAFFLDTGGQNLGATAELDLIYTTIPEPALATAVIGLLLGMCCRRRGLGIR